MIFQDNIIKQYLKNVYFIAGTPCGGKTTVSRALAKKYNIPVYDIDERFPEHQAMSDPASQPAMNKDFREFFGRSVDEYKAWLLQNTREQLDFVLLDLMRMSKDQIVLCDCHLTLEQAAQVTDPSHVAFMLRKPVNLVDEYCNRPDHQGFSDFIHSATDFEAAKATCNETLMSLNAKYYEDVKASGYFFVDRADGLSVEETVTRTAKHFGFTEKFKDAKTGAEPAEGKVADEKKTTAGQQPAADGVTIVKVEKDTTFASEFLHFVENCSWSEVREHIAGLIREWQFTDWETMFAAVKDGRIIGMTSVLKTDYYPLPDIFPWVSCVFVEKPYRGQRISEKLIDTANEYAKEQGFTKTYIPTEFTGLYERYGYRYIKDIVNYGGGTDRLYGKDLQ